MNKKRCKTALGPKILALGIILSAMSCAHSKDAATISSDGPSVAWGKKGEQPTVVWDKRPWVICDATVYYCHVLE